MTDILVEKVHHRFGGSTAKFWRNCYGWASEMESLPPQIVGEPALKGTALHTGAELYFIGQINHLLYGKPIPEVDFESIPNFPSDGEVIVKDYWQAVWVNVLEEIITGKVVYLEHKLMLNEELDCGGSADVAVLYKNDRGQVVLWIGDLKTGYRRVGPSDEQLLFYTAAATERARSKGVAVEVFKTFVYQPTHSEPFTTHTFTKSQVERATKAYLKSIGESKKDKRKYKVGEYCEFCRAQATCKAYNKHISTQMDVTVQADTAFPPVESLPDETLVKIWKAGDSIEGYISAVRKHIIQRFSMGRPLPGLKIVGGVAKRRWPDDDSVAIEKLEGAGIEATTKKIIGIGEAEKRLKAIGMKKDEIEPFMYQITTKPSPPPKVVEESDPREAIDLAPVNLLEGLDDVSELI